MMCEDDVVLSVLMLTLVQYNMCAEIKVEFWYCTSGLTITPGDSVYFRAGKKIDYCLVKCKEKHTAVIYFQSKNHNKTS